MVQKSAQTPMMQQYSALKQKFPDAFLFFRLGDFYELFNDDALKAARLLEITLTSRNKSADEPIPMCGVPYHAADEYIKRLIEAGYKVAIAEQLEDPKLTKGMVKRDVIKVLTPGTYIEGQEGSNNYITALMKQGERYALAYADLGTGEFQITSTTKRRDIFNEFAQLQSKELIVATDFTDESLLQQLHTYHDFVLSKQQIRTLKAEDVCLLDSIHHYFEKQVGSLLLAYIEETQFTQRGQMKAASRYDIDHYLHLDHYAKQNLELTSSIRTKKASHSLYAFLNETKTAMGSRLLRQWLNRPLIDQEAISERQDVLDALIDHYFERQGIRENLQGVYDLERLIARVALGQATPRQLLQLKASLERVPHLRDSMAACMASDKPVLFKKALEKMKSLPEIVSLIARAISPKAGVNMTEGDIIADGYDEKLDEYRDIKRHGQEWLVQMQAEERQKTGIKSLKIGFNKVFGYYIEVTKANLHILDEGQYERKQTLSNAERFVTPELKAMEEKMREAEALAVALEYELFVQVRNEVQNYQKALQAIAKEVAQLDVLQALSEVSEKQQFTRPKLSLGGQKLKVIDSRHPVVEQVVGRETFVPNNIEMDEATQILLITGPNMSGKSTFMRQLGLIVIMAQMGCFVPAKSAELPIFDRIFTRIGAADDLFMGQSTFMVEMMEANDAIQYATDSSLLLFDEIGRGTSTYDGIALAQAILQYLHASSKAKVLFSTHYHELTTLEETLRGLKNIHVGVKEEADEVTFLHKIYPGAADKSYGIHVAKLAGLPKSLLREADQILQQLTKQKMPPKMPPNKYEQLSLFTEDVAETNSAYIWEDKIKQIDLNHLSPLEALNLLAEWQADIEEG